MISKKSFSILEMMVVILIILLLLSLVTPIFVNLKMNARASICKGNLRQISVLLTSYVTDHGGYLPYKNAMGAYSGDPASDIPIPATGNNELYRYWNGHLLPYLDVNLPEIYTRSAMVTKVGTTRWNDGLLGSNIESPPPANVYTKGWIVVDDAYHIGGYQDLKAFICPEIHHNTFDVEASLTWNGVRIPRISQLCNQGFQDQAGFDYGMNGGVPTTYLANAKFFGYEGNINSYRMDQIENVSQKVFHVEGGLAHAGGNGESAPPYYMTNTYSAYTGGALIARFDKGSSGVHKLSFVHDNYDQFWIMSSEWWSFYFPGGSEEWKGDLAAKFNSQFAGKASMVLNSCGWSFDYSIGYDIVSYINPYQNGETNANGTIFDIFFVANGCDMALRQFVAFTDEPNDWKYLVGEMNALFGDGAVLKKDAAWLCNNRIKISMDSKQ